MIHGLAGNGQGRCAVDWSSGSTKQFIHSVRQYHAENGLRGVRLPITMQALS